MDDPAGFLKAVQLAMRLEGISEESIEHVINRLVYGDPRGPVRHRASEAGQAVQIHMASSSPDLGREFVQGLRAMLQRAWPREAGLG